MSGDDSVNDPDFEDDDFGFENDDEYDEEERLLDECGRLPEHLGGGCQLAGTEHCDFECPLRDGLFGEDDDE